jgi:hypothetical protein
VVERFRREVEIVRKIAHPHVLAIHQVVDSDGQLFLVMDYHPGGDLADRLAVKRALDAGDVRDLAAQLCGALAAAHRAGVVHRDVKPSNVLCGAGPRLDVRLCDFGLARTAELSGLTTANAVLGTPEYMAPEVVIDGHADPRSDIYSLGVMLFEAATGRLPFYGDSPYQLMRQHVDVEAPRARGVAPDLPPAIDAAIARALAKDPLDRFATAEDLARALRDEAAVVSSAAVAPATVSAIPARRTCPKCGGWLVEAAAACADCGVALLRVEDRAVGGVSVMVTGPGQPGDKIDAHKHVALFKILDELPPGRVPVGRGRRRAPRVPFYVARGITRRSAGELVARLHAVGFDARVETRRALASREMRKKFSAMTARHSVSAGGLFYLGSQFGRVISHWVGHDLFLLLFPSAFLVWASAFAATAFRYSRPLVTAGRHDGPDASPSRRLAETLPRLRSRQDRRLVARILERSARTQGFARSDLGGALLARAASAGEALATLDMARDAGVAVSPDPDRALTTLRREEVTRVVLRTDLLRVASRFDDLCVVVARANAVGSSEETTRLEAEIQELALAVESEQEIAALLKDKG